MILTRLPNWRPRLDAYLDWLDGQTFDWAEISCGLFAAGCVQAVTNVDFAEPFRGKVKDAKSAQRALLKAGYKTVADLAADRLEEDHPSKLQMGDIASVMLDSGPTLYLVSGSFLTGMGERGKVFLPLTSADRGFRVG